MYKVSLQHWIGNAAAVLLGSHGDVTAQADKAGCSRETAYQHARKVEQILQEAHLSGPSRADLLEQVQLLRSENQHLRQQLANRIEFDKVRRKRLAATCSAAGLSLNQIEEV